jgi:lactate dehydrogenase-like 2-hydroxyacid dehydrogenase
MEDCMPQTPVGKPAAEKPHILLSHEMLMPMQPLLEGAYTVHRLWDYPDHLAFLDGPGRSVRAIVHAGEMALHRDMLSEMPRLGLIACVSVGYDGVDVPWCKAHGISVTHSTGLNAGDVADHAVGLVLAAWRGIVEGDHRLRSGHWTHAERMAPRHGLRGRKAGIVGLGHIGEAVARRLEAFEMKVAWWAPRHKETERPRAESLLAALNDGRLGMAGLDVFEKEPASPARWAGVPHTVLTPHTAGATLDSIPAMVNLTLENLRCYFHGEPLATPVGA